MRPRYPVLAARREAAAGGASHTTVTSASTAARRRSASSQVGQSSVTNMTTAEPAASRSASPTGPPVVLGSSKPGAGVSPTIGMTATYRKGFAGRGRRAGETRDRAVPHRDRRSRRHRSRPRDGVDVRREPPRRRGGDPPRRGGGAAGPGGRAPGGLTAIPYPEPDLTGSDVVLRRWTPADVACAAEGKGVDRDSALAWIEAQLERQADGAGLSLA